MMTMAVDTLKAMKRLTAVGVEEAQAEAFIETFGAAMTESLATKDDLAFLKADLTAEIVAGIAEVRTEIGEVRGEIAGAESRLETKIESVRTEIAEVRTEIAESDARNAERYVKIGESDARNAERYVKIAEGQATQLRWMVGCMIAIAGVFVSALLLGT